MRVTLLPHYFKKIGFFLALTTFILLVLNHFSVNLLYLKSLAAVGKPVFIIALLIMSFTKDKVETEDLYKLRYKHLKFSIVFVAFILIINQIYGLFTGNNAAVYSGNELLRFILVLYLVQYNFSRFLSSD